MNQSTLQEFVSTGVECPTCGESGFKNRHGMKIHHARSHDESIAGKEVECDHCGDDFPLRPNKARKQDNTFCSRACRGAWQSENKVGESNPAWKDNTVAVSCRNCGESFQAKKIHFKESYSKHNPTYCSNECQWEDAKTRYAGEGNPRWEGGEFSKGPGWGYSKSLEVRKRDRATCQDCGISENDAVEQGIGHLHVHHICGARESTNPAVYNAQRNLITLCVHCHRQWETAVPGKPEHIQHDRTSREWPVVKPP